MKLFPRRKNQKAKPAVTKTDAQADSRPGRWERFRRITARVVIIGLVLAVVFRMSLVFIVPAVIHRVAGFYGLSASFERMQLNVLGTDAGLWHLTISPKEGGDPLATIDYVRANIATLSLLWGKLHVYRAETEGVELQLKRTADGRLPLVDRILSELPQNKQSQATSQLELSPPLRVDALRLSNLKVVFTDAATFPEVASDIRLNLSVTDLDSPQRPSRFLVELRADPILDYLLIEGQGLTSPQELQADVTVQVRGLRPHAVTGYLQLLGLTPQARQLDMHMTGHANIQVVPPAAGTQPAPGQPPASPSVKGMVELKDIALTADGQEVAALDQMEVDISALSGDLANCAIMSIKGVRLQASRSATGSLLIGGVELKPSAPADTQPAQEPAPAASTQLASAPEAAPDATPEVTPAPTTSPASNFRWRLGELDLSDVAIRFKDDFIAPATELSLLVDQLAIHNISNRPLGPDTKVELTGLTRSPGMAGSIKVGGSLQPFQTPLKLDAQLQVTQIKPDAIGPYLLAMGLESLIEDASLNLQLQAHWTPGQNNELTAGLAIRDVQLTDRQQPLLKIDAIDVDTLHLQPAGRRVSVEDIRIEGTTLSAVRQPDGALRTLGLRTRVPGASTTQPVSATQPKTTGWHLPDPLAGFDVLESLPQITLGRFSWTGLDLSWEDQMVSPAAASQIRDAGVKLERLVFDPQQKTLPETGAEYHLWLTAPGVLGKVGLAGDVHASGAGVSLRFNADAENLRTAFLSPYLAPMGVEPVLKNATLALAGQLDVGRPSAGDQDHWVLSATIHRLKMAQDQQTLVSMDRFELKELSFHDQKLKVESVLIDTPVLDITRQTDGELDLLGLRLGASTQTPSPAPSNAAVASPADALAGPLALLDQIKASAGQVVVSDARLGWTDRAVTPQVNTAVHNQTRLAGLSIGEGKAGGTFEIDTRIDDIVGQSKVVGRLTIADASPRLELQVTASELTPMGLAGYLPSGLEMPWRAGAFKAEVNISAGANARGGQQARVEVTELDLREASADRPWLKFDQALIDLTRLDTKASVVHLKQLSLDGLETGGGINAQGHAHAAGILLKPVPPAEPATTQPAETATTAPAETPVENLSQILASRRRAAPLITVDELRVTAPAITWLDELRTPDAPLTLRQLSLRSEAPIELLGPNPSQTKPVRMKLEMQPEPLAQQVDVSIFARPFDDQARIGLDLDIQGITGRGVLSQLPELAGQFTGDDLTQGRFKTRLFATAKLDRTRPWDIDFSKGGVFTLSLADTQLLQSPDGPTLAGVKEVRLDAIQVSNQWKSIRVGAAEVNQITLNTWRDATGLQVLGLTMLPPAMQQPAPAQAVSTAPSTTPQASPARQALLAEPANRPEQTITIDRLVVSGLDGKFEDRTATPPVVLPLTGLELEARYLSSWPWANARPTRFNLLVQAGKVQVPRRQRGLGLVGALGDTAILLSGQSNASSQPPAMIERDLFSQITASGRVRLGEKPNGWLKFSMNGPDLWPIRGLASMAGVTIDSGVLDVSADARIKSQSELNTQTRVVFTDLSMSEPSGGLISRHLALPAPLDAVIGMLEAPDGSLTISLPLTIREGQLTGDQIFGAALSATQQVIVSAVAAAPLKIVGGAGSLVGLGGLGQGKAPREYQPVLLTYLPGNATLEGNDAQAFNQLVDQLRANSRLTVTLRHQLGQGDVAAASLRANPSQEEAMQLIQTLSRQAIELSHQRAQLAGQARAQLASMAEKQSQETLVKLRAVDQELLRLSTAQEGLYDLLRPGAQRQASRRTRAAAIALGQARLEALTQALYQTDLPDIRSRVSQVAAQYNPAEPLEDGSTPPGVVEVQLVEVRR